MTGRAFRPRLVALDADGTIVGSDDRVPSVVADELRRIDALGVPVVLATGRAWLSAQLVLDQVCLPRAYCVCNNGATVVTYPPLEVVSQEVFDPTPVIAAVRDHPSVIMAVEEFGRGYKVSRPFPQGMYELHGEIRVVDWEELAREPVSRVILRDPVADPAEFDAFVASLDLAGLTFSKGGDNWFDLGPGAAGKDKGLAVVARALGVDRAEVLAIGDSWNDVDMIRWAGRGVAVGGAPAELVAVADAVTGAFEEGGVVAELGRYFSRPAETVEDDES